MTHGSLFSGIGGFDLAAEWMGWENLFHCEWNPFCQKVLKYYWPNAIQYHDICTTDFRPWHGKRDVLTGGFPCQPFSTAGQRKGTDDDRYLWPEMLRAIREIAPRFVVGENVDGIFTWNNGLVFETVCADLENEGYEIQAYRIPACATGAPHRRDRWWFVAHRTGSGPGTPRTGGGTGSNQCPIYLQPGERGTTPQRPERCAELSCNENATHHNLKGLERQEPKGFSCAIGQSQQFDGVNNDATDSMRFGQSGQGQHRTPSNTTANGNWEEHRIKHGHQFEEHWFKAATRLCILDDGLPGRLDSAALSCKPQHAAGKWRKESLKAAGNAVVPQIPYAIFQAIEQTMTTS